MKLVLLLAVIVGVCSAANWGVLIAGSNGYGNYRHQADICHAYQIMHRNGVPESNIIVFMYDDIANSGSNPYKGKIFNKPTPKGTPGVDVYAGVPKDYTGSLTTAKNLLAVLQGQKDKVPAGKKVLESTENDNVFVYYSDHGATGLVAMPVGGYLYSTDLIAALKAMHTKKMYNKLVFYIEACESGSMFDKVLPTDINVFGTTASNPDESSWGWYCDEETGGDEVNGKSIGSCLGDEYSVRWMEDSDKAVKTETLQQQFEEVRKITTKSHVMEYGTMAFSSDKIWDFQGEKNTTTPRPQFSPSVIGSGVDSRDAQLHFLFKQYTRRPTAEHAEALEAEIKSRQTADSFFANLARTVFGNEYKQVITARPTGICEEKCCQPVVDYIHDNSAMWTDYSLKYVRSIVNMCEQGSNSEYILEAAKNLL